MPATAIRVPLARVRLGRLDDDRLAALAGQGDERAFEALYDRHHRALLGFCRHMLGSSEEGEDALQQTFLRAHRSLRARGGPDELRPWLFAIARNRCLTLLAARRTAALPAERLEPATEALGAAVERRAELRALLGDIDRLPEDQRAALVLAELADLSHVEIAMVIGVQAEKVKALVHQARSRLIAEREARETPCEAVREQLATARGGQLRRGPLRRHLAVCASCRAYKSAVAEQRAALALVLPVLPSAGLKDAVLGAISGGGGGGTAAAVGAAAGGAGGSALSGGGAGLAAKLAVGAALAGGAGGGAVAVEEITTDADHGARPAAVAQAPAKASGAPAGRSPWLGASAGAGASVSEESSGKGRARRLARGRAGAQRGAAGKRFRETARRGGAAKQKTPKVVRSERAADRAAAKQQRRALRATPSPSSPATRKRTVVTKAAPRSGPGKTRQEKISARKPAAVPAPARSPGGSREHAKDRGSPEPLE